MKPLHFFAASLALAALAMAAAPAQAALVTFDFASGADMPVGTLGVDFLACDGSGQDRCGDTLAFEKSGVSVTASVAASDSHDAGVIQDLHPDHGGLGIVDAFREGHQDGNDNVSDDEVILLTLGSSALLKRVAFEDDHEELAFGSHSNFFFSTNGMDWTNYSLEVSGHPWGPLWIDFDEPGSTFYFKHAGQGKDDFYIAGIEVEVEPVPEPSTVLLLGAGILGLVGCVRRRRH